MREARLGKFLGERGCSPSRWMARGAVCLHHVQALGRRPCAGGGTLRWDAVSLFAVRRRAALSSSPFLWGQMYSVRPVPISMRWILLIKSVGLLL